MKTKQIWFSELCTCTASTEQQQTNQFNVIQNIGWFSSNITIWLKVINVLVLISVNINSSFFQLKKTADNLYPDWWQEKIHRLAWREEESCMASFNIYEIKMESVKSEMWCSDLYKYGYGVSLFRLWLTLVILWELNMNHSHDLSKQMIS